GVLANRLQHPEALAGVAEKALVDERLQRVEIRARNLLRGLERGAAAEDGQLAEQALFHRVEQMMAPLNRRAQRLLARVGVPSTSEQVEPLRQAFEDLDRGEHARPRCCQLDGEREVVQATTQSGDRLVGFEPRALAEE